MSNSNSTEIIPDTKEAETTSTDQPNPPKDLILTVSKRGVIECDYCKRDISQVPRIRCADCPQNEHCTFTSVHIFIKRSIHLY